MSLCLPMQDSLIQTERLSTRAIFLLWIFLVAFGATLAIVLI
ncbi:hypothetical protein [Oceanispirochaeta sp.]|jgi:hypothetical protein|nr:hypothetical protein [Oceanispirochaeta sp.]MDA3958029.1 hypothetical protein [Oceanispirochaeta sp.]